jgi:hypothetical protein
MGDSLDLGGRSHWFVGSQATFRVDKVGCEDGIDQGGFPESSLACTQLDQTRQGMRCVNFELTNTDNIELETTLQQLALNLSGDAVETDVASGKDRVLRHGARGCHDQ